MRVLVVVHVFYAEMWPELAACIRNVGACDVCVTYVDEAAAAAARRDFPSARFLACANCGFDVWPFLCALKAADLAAYDVVVKLHTKRNIVRDFRFTMGRTVLNGDAWRRHLLSFVATPGAWARTCARLADPKVGMVGPKALVFGRREGAHEIFDAAVRELRAEWRLPATRRGLFVAGTMFAARAAVLAPAAAHPFAAAQFTASARRDAVTYAHVLERLLGLAVGAQGYRVAAWDGSVRAHRFWGAVARFLFEVRRSERRRTVRVCGVTVYRRRLVED